MIADLSYSQNFYTGTPPEATHGTEGGGGWLRESVQFLGGEIC